MLKDYGQFTLPTEASAELVGRSGTDLAFSGYGLWNLPLF
jgi:hypothetical protein